MLLEKFMLCTRDQLTLLLTVVDHMKAKTTALMPGRLGVLKNSHRPSPHSTITRSQKPTLSRTLKISGLNFPKKFETSSRPGDFS